MNTLFEKYGGFATFSQLTSLFYQKILDTPDVAHFFEDIDIEKLIEHQTQFLVSALGGPPLQRNVDMKKAHHGLGIAEKDFIMVAEILEDSLVEMGVEAGDIETILSIVSGYKDDIVSV